MSYILVVDDERHICWLVEEALTGEGYTVKTATGWEKALEIVKEEAPALILLDLKLPGVSGATLLREIRRLAPQSKVLVMTGETEAAEGLEVTCCLAKPFDLADLRRIVKDTVPLFPQGP
ncbi:MAG: response regulator [Bacillota bacterium]